VISTPSGNSRYAFPSFSNRSSLGVFKLYHICPESEKSVSKFCASIRGRFPVELNAFIISMSFSQA
ncbi:MAG: hypothetical protein GQ525_14450, partial [Draconibacterium sp.]|nr:hypothetical protein [Draconibacterium sp.]